MTKVRKVKAYWSFFVIKCEDYSMWNINLKVYLQPKLNDSGTVVISFALQ